MAIGNRKALLVVLGAKFGTPVPADVLAAIERQSDLDVLTRWFKAALEIWSIHAYRQEFARYPAPPGGCDMP